MNREDAHSAKEELHFLLSLPSCPLRLRGLIIPMQPDAIYSHPTKSFVNFLLPPLDKGRVGVGSKIYDSCKDCYNIQGIKNPLPKPMK